MSEFRLTQISDTHLARRLPSLTDNFERVSHYIEATRPDLMSTAVILRSMDRLLPMISNLPGACTQHFARPVGICPVIMISATIRRRLARHRPSR